MQFIVKTRTYDSLEENDVKPPNESFENCFNEAVKCHHNDLAIYIKDVLMNEEKIDYKNCFKYCNFRLIPDELKNNSIFYYLCHYNYSKLVELYLEERQENIIEEIIQI